MRPWPSRRRRSGGDNPATSRGSNEASAPVRRDALGREVWLADNSKLVGFPDAVRLADATVPGWRTALRDWPDALSNSAAGFRRVAQKERQAVSAPRHAALCLESPAAAALFARLPPLDEYALGQAIGQRLFETLPPGSDGFGLEDSWSALIMQVDDETDLVTLGEAVAAAFERPLDPYRALLIFFARGERQWMAPRFVDYTVEQALAELTIDTPVCPVRLGVAFSNAAGEWDDTDRRARRARKRARESEVELEPTGEQRRLIWRGHPGFRGRPDALAAEVASALQSSDVTLLAFDGGARLRAVEPGLRSLILTTGYRDAMHAVTTEDSLAFHLPDDIYVAVLPAVSAEQAAERGEAMAAVIANARFWSGDPEGHSAPWGTDERFPPRIAIASAPCGSDAAALIMRVHALLAAQPEADAGTR